MELLLLDDRASIAHFKTIMEFARALRLHGFAEEDVRKIIAHENDHFNIAEKHGARGDYRIEFCRDKNGNIRIIPSVMISIPGEKGTLEAHRIMREILNAPHDMSESDVEKRRHLK
jgi:hypothetical protein